MKKLQKKKAGIVSAGVTIAIVAVMAFFFLSNPESEKKIVNNGNSVSAVEGLAVERSNPDLEKIKCEQDKEIKRECSKCKKADVTYNNADCSTFTRTVDDENCVEQCVSSSSTVRTSVTVLPD